MNKIKALTTALLILFFTDVLAHGNRNEYSQIPIGVVTDSTVVHLLANLEILGELTAPSSPYFVRIVKVKDFGECDGSLETCTKEVLYVIVSTYDEFPDQKVYLFPKSFGWNFVKWISIPSKDDPQSFVTLRLTKQDISADRRKVEIGVDVRVNPWQGYATFSKPTESKGSASQ